MEERDDPSPAARRRGIYLLPNLLTTGALFAGFYAILAAMKGEYHQAGAAVFVAMFFDGLDGQVARLTNTQSDFGIQYDSLSDMVSFGVAPAVLAFSWMLHHLGKLGWAAAFVYASCAALRLARFNSQAGSADRRHFIGLPSPTAAALVAGLAWLGHDWPPHFAATVGAAAVTALAGILMVSNFRYRSLKGIDLRGRVPFPVILGVVLLLVAITVDPPAVLLALAALYTATAPVGWLWEWWRRRTAAGAP